jgi:hypothetical protein
VLGNHRFRLEKAHLQRRRRTTASSSNMPLSVSVVAVSVLVPRGDRSRPGRELRVEVLRGGGDGDSVPVPGRDQIGGKRTCCATVNLLRAPTREYRASGRTCYARADLRAAQADLLRPSGLVGRRRRRDTRPEPPKHLPITTGGPRRPTTTLPLTQRSSTNAKGSMTAPEFHPSIFWNQVLIRACTFTSPARTCRSSS